MQFRHFGFRSTKDKHLQFICFEGSITENGCEPLKFHKSYFHFGTAAIALSPKI